MKATAVVAGAGVMVMLLGVSDYLTGDYSLIIFYLLPIAAAGWYGGVRCGLFIAGLCGCARFLSDYFLHGLPTSSLHTWNLLVELIFFTIVALLVTTLNRALGRHG